jgi:death-on-curing protein
MLDYLTSTGGGAAVSSPQYLTEGDSGLIIHRDASTNTIDPFCGTQSQSSDISVDATFAYAFSHYSDLLRRLAD